MENVSSTTVSEPNKTLLIVEDDKPFATRLSRAMESRGFNVEVAETVEDGLTKIRNGLG